MNLRKQTATHKRFVRSVATSTILFACIFLASVLTASASVPASPAKEAASTRRAELVESNIVAVQAYQIILARKAGMVSNNCYPAVSPDTATLEVLVKHQQSLLAEPREEVVRWADGRSSSFDPANDLRPLLDARLPLSPSLPVNVFTRYLQAKAPAQPEERIRSVANLYQTILETERDGDLLQDLYRFYIALGLPVYVGQFGLPGSDADFLVAAQELSGKSCASPVDLSIPAWQIAGRKVWNWGEKNLHIRDKETIAKELLAEPRIAALIPAMKAMPAERIAIIGHSFTMGQHWASPSSFVPIVTSMFDLERSSVEFRQWQAGGLHFARAYHEYYADALAWKPNIVLFVMSNSRPADAEALKTMAAGFRASGARVLMFDDVEDSIRAGEPSAKETDNIASKAGVEIVPARTIIDTAPSHESFTCLDGIHKKEPYHRLMAYLWLKAILANR